MPTLQVTRELATTLRHMKDGRALCKSWRDGEYLLCQRTTTSDQITVKEEIFEALKKQKLIQMYDGGYIWWTNWYGRSRVWVLSDAGNHFPIPPESMWLEDEPVQPS